MIHKVQPVTDCLKAQRQEPITKDTSFAKVLDDEIKKLQRKEGAATDQSYTAPKGNNLKKLFI